MELAAVYLLNLMRMVICSHSPAKGSLWVRRQPTALHSKAAYVSLGPSLLGCAALLSEGIQEIDAQPFW